MDKITEYNFEQLYNDSIETERIDKFVCDEMDRQIHRYIKAMHGSKQTMDQFVAQLRLLDVPAKEQAIARYIDFNRKAVRGLDFKIVVARAYANYCDSYDYLLYLLGDEKRMARYLKRIEEKYLRFHEVFESDGHYGIRDSKGNILIQPRYEFLRRVFAYVDEISLMPIVAQYQGKFGLILPDGNDTVVADFVYDEISLRDEYPFFEATQGGLTGYLGNDGAFIAKTI